MVSTTASDLIKCCRDDLLPSNIATISDYFGDNLDDIEFFILFGVYQGLVKFSGVDEELLHKCYFANRLDELIHKKYKYNPSGYYEKLKVNKIVVGKTAILNGTDMSFEIYDDDHCTNCLKKGYITSRKTYDMDCPECLKYVCKLCGKLGKDGMPIHSKCMK